MPSRRSMILMVLGLAVVAALAWISFRDDPVPVDLATVTRGAMEVTVNADGRTRVRKLYEVASPIAGTALRSPVEVGDRVEAGVSVVAIVRPAASPLLDERSRRQALATLQEAEGTLHLAETEREQAGRDHAFAQTQYKRATELVNRGVATITRLEDAAQRLAITVAAVETADARIELARGAIRRAEATLMNPEGTGAADEACCVDILAPADGLVLSVATISERPVTPGTPLLAIGDPADLELVADILSSDGVRLTRGAHAHVERWGGEGVLHARLDRIDPSAVTKVSALGIEEQRVDAFLTLLTPPDQRPGLGHGFAVFLRIVEWRGEDVLRVPVSALYRRGDGWSVFVAADGTAEERPLAIGHRNSTQAEVIEGLSEGERVILHPSDRVRDGAAIAERRTL